MKTYSNGAITIYTRSRLYGELKLLYNDLWDNQKPTENDIVDAILTKYKRQDKNPFIGKTEPWRAKWKN